MKKSYTQAKATVSAIEGRDSILVASIFVPMKIFTADVTVEPFLAVKDPEGNDYFDITFE